MPEVTIAAELRTEFGKGAARRIRRADKVPAVLYGHGTNPVHIALPGHETMLALKTANVLLELSFDDKLELALPKHVQRDPLKGYIEHVDVAVVTTGEAAPDTIVVQENQTISVEAEATRIPNEVEVSIEGAEAGTQIHAKDITLPDGVTLVADPETLVINITATQTAEQFESELGEVAEAETGVEAASEAPATAESAES